MDRLVEYADQASSCGVESSYVHCTWNWYMERRQNHNVCNHDLINEISADNLQSWKGSQA
jgi:hypothetical protein